jgi:hypothetical protein
MTLKSCSSQSNNFPSSVSSLPRHRQRLKGSAEEECTGALLEALFADVDRSLRNLQKALRAGRRGRDGVIYADTDSESRQLINSVIACFDGTTYAIKIAALDDCMTNGQEVSSAEVDLVFEVRRQLSPGGAVIERPRTVELGRNLRFAISLYERAHGLNPALILQQEKWWHLLHRSIKVRRRFTFPRCAADLWVQPREALDAIEAQRLFGSSILDLIHRAESFRRTRRNARPRMLAAG